VLLGTVVAVRVRGVAPHAAHRAIDRAFAAIAEIHRLMSFHENASDVSRLNRGAAAAPVAVHLHTFRVLTWAAHMAKLSAGLFDVSVGSILVERGMLPSPAGGARPARNASFRDIELGSACQVFFRRPLWVDVGGIAKGYAVDCAVAALRACGIMSACVNAGGDMRTIGAEGERVLIRTAAASVDALPLMQIHGGALATSCGASFSRSRHVKRAGAHMCGRGDEQTTVSVLAGRCIVADALTKVVLADQAAAAPLLRRFRAVAHVHHPDYPGSGWRRVGAAR
jgi:FAD:protein FMN transferase